MVEAEQVGRSQRGLPPKEKPDPDCSPLDIRLNFEGREVVDIDEVTDTEGGTVGIDEVTGNENATHPDVEDATSSSGGSKDSDAIEEIFFKDDDAFYSSVTEMCTTGEAFRIRLDYMSLDKFSLRLKELVGAREGLRYHRLWRKAFQAPENSPEAKRGFDIHFERDFYAGEVEENWADFNEEFDAQLPEVPRVGVALPMLGAAGGGYMIHKLIVNAYYATRYGIVWSWAQDKRRLGWIAGLAAVGAAAWPIGGGLAGAAGVALGATVGVISTGKRKAVVRVGRPYITITCK